MSTTTDRSRVQVGHRVIQDIVRGQVVQQSLGLDFQRLIVRINYATGTFKLRFAVDVIHVQFLPLSRVAHIHGFTLITFFISSKIVSVVSNRWSDCRRSVGLLILDFDLCAPLFELIR